MRTRGSWLLLASVLLAGCGGSGGEASKPAARVLADAGKAAAGARTVHVTGVIQTGNKRISLDLELRKGKGATGSMALNGKSFRLVRLGKTIYIRGSKAFLDLYAGQFAGALQGTWLKASASKSELRQFEPLTDAARLFSLIGSNHGKLVNDGLKSYAGQQTVEIRDTSDNSKLYVAAGGTPYPVAIAGPTRSAGAIVFSNWNKPVSLSAPKKALDLSKLGAG